VLAPWNVEPVSTLDWPGSLASQDGRCPEGLWELVHYRGTRRKHAALAAWERGEEFAFDEPAVAV
jgi:hypothetical protein